MLNALVLSAALLLVVSQAWAQNERQPSPTASTDGSLEQTAPPVTARSRRPPAVKRTEAERAIIGEHPFTLQWLSWKTPGRVTITDDGERLRIQGVQETADGEVTIEGDVREVKPRSFVVVGEVTMRVNFLDEGAPCTRKGVLHFRRSGKRKYWRMREMDSPCGGGTTDYVDVYMRKLKPARSTSKARRKASKGDAKDRTR